MPNFPTRITQFLRAQTLEKEEKGINGEGEKQKRDVRTEKTWEVQRKEDGKDARRHELTDPANSGTYRQTERRDRFSRKSKSGKRAQVGPADHNEPRTDVCEYSTANFSYFNLEEHVKLEKRICHSSVGFWPTPSSDDEGYDVYCGVHPFLRKCASTITDFRVLLGSGIFLFVLATALLLQPAFGVTGVTLDVHLEFGDEDFFNGLSDELHQLLPHDEIDLRNVAKPHVTLYMTSFLNFTLPMVLNEYVLSLSSL